MKRLSNTAKIPVAGFKRTPQRIAILEYLDGNKTHPSAEDVFKAVSRKYHSMSFATVYNTLNALVDAGVLKGLNIDPERRRFDPDTRPHHHCICLRCKKIIDVYADMDVKLPANIGSDFTAVSSHVEFYGYCSRCSKKAR